ncbi:MAG: hypothetical protein ABW221_12870 [Vicinamibacteria bacterium]
MLADWALVALPGLIWGSSFLLIALGVLVRDECVAPLALAGGAVCLAGAWLLRRARRPRRLPKGPGSSVYQLYEA